MALLLAGITCWWVFIMSYWFNTLRPRQNGRHFADDIFNCNFFNEMVWISIKISLKLVPGGSINNISALVQIMAWRRPGDKPLSEPMMVCLLTHICVTRPQWVNYVYHGINPFRLHYYSVRTIGLLNIVPILVVARPHDSHKQSRIWYRLCNHDTLGPQATFEILWCQ